MYVMMAGPSAPVLAGLLVLLGTMVGSTHLPKHVSLTLLCEFQPGPGKGVLINESTIMQADFISMLTVKLCNLTIATSKKNNMVLINFLTFDIGNTCDDGIVDIFDYFTGSSITGQLCGHSLKKTVFRSYTRAVSFVATPNKDPMKSYPPHLRILLTSYNNGSGGKCSKGEFQCANKLCVAGDLVCNGYDECSDGSDEKNCGHTTSVNIGLVAGSVVGGVAFLVLLVLGILGCRKLMRRRRLGSYESA